MVNGMRITFQSSLINTVGFNLNGKQSNLERMLSPSNFHSSAPKVASRVCGGGVWFIYTWRWRGDGSSMYPGASANLCYSAAGWGWAAPELVTAGEGLGLSLGLLLLWVAGVRGQDNSWSILSLLFRTPWAPLLTLPYLSPRGVVDHPETCYGSYVFPSQWHQLSGHPQDDPLYTLLPDTRLQILFRIRRMGTESCRQTLDRGKLRPISGKEFAWMWLFQLVPG